MDERIKAFDEKMQKTIEFLEEDYASIRAGRANPHLLDKIKVDYYGTPSGLNAVANISVPEARIIQIQPWEAKMVKEISKAILASDLGITPTDDGRVIRLVFPELTEDRRKELAKDIKKKGENAKVAVRNVRRDANEAIKKIGLDTARAVLDAPRDLLIEKADLEEDTVDEVLRILRAEFED